MCKVYEVVNQRIMELLEQGTVPWRKTWNVATNQPKNLISKKEYRGINLWVLANGPFSSPYWLTFKQCQDKGGQVLKGAKATPVVFWKWLDRKDATTEGDADVVAGNGKIPMLRMYNVFNLDQVKGIEAPPTTEPIINTFTPIESAAQIVANMPLRPEIKHGGNSASYSPMLDYVKLPKPEAFESAEEYANTLFHELSHSTGNAKRVGRKGILEPSFFGSHEYSKEELVAEMSACYLSSYAGIERTTIVNSAAYIQGWLRSLRNDKTLLIQAAAQAQKSSDYILNITHSEDHTD
jgi:antirestriction protein ArdC